MVMVREESWDLRLSISAFQRSFHVFFGGGGIKESAFFPPRDEREGLGYARAAHPLFAAAGFEERNKIQLHREEDRRYPHACYPAIIHVLCSLFSILYPPRLHVESVT